MTLVSRSDGSLCAGRRAAPSAARRSRPPRRPLWTFALSVALLMALLAAASFGTPRPSWAQESPPAPATPQPEPPAPPATPAPAPPAAGLPAPPAPAADADGVLRERTIYVPYSKLRETFEKDGRGVFLPYEQFQELWQAAQAGKLAASDETPPTGALLSEIDSAATVDRDVLRVVARLKIELLAEGWHRVPLRLGDAAILSAKIGNAPAHVVFDRDGYYLLVRHPGAKPAAQPAPGPAPNPEPAPNPATGPTPVPPVSPVPPAPAAGPRRAVESHRFELTLEYAKAYVKNPGQNSVSVEAPQAPVNRWQITIPQAGAKVTVAPLIAATEGPSAPPGKPDAPPGVAKPNGKDGAKDGAKVGPPAGESTLLAFVGSAPNVRIEWTVKAEGATGLAALVNVQSRQEVRLDEGVVRTTARLAYEITRAELSQLQIEAPADQKVVNVFDANVRGWEVKVAGEVQTITVQLFQPVRGAQNVVVELERFLADMNQKNLELPVVKALGVGRQQGVLLVHLAPELRAEVVRRTGLTQLDANEPSIKSDQAPPAFPFRYATLPAELALSVERVQPRIQVKELTEAYLEADHLTVDLLALYEIERAGVFQLELDLPEGFDVRRVAGQAAAGHEAVAVESHQTTGEKKTRLVVNLSRKAFGKAALVVGLHRRLDDPNLLSPTGKSSEFKLVVPRVAPTGVERSEGRVVVFAPEGLRVNPTNLTGLRPVSAPEAYQGAESLRAGRFPAVREVFAFAYGPSPVELTLSAERRKPAVTARQLLAVRVEPGVVKYQAQVFYDIRFSGVKQLRLDVPQELAAKLHNETPQIREKPIEKPDPAPAPGYVAWSLSGETELLGQVAVRFTWELPLEELAVGKSRQVSIGRLAPVGAELERAHGQLVLAKSESLDIRPAAEPKGLRPIDPQHDLMPEAQGEDWARAFEFQADWSLDLAVQRYQLEEVKRTSIELGVVRMVVTRGGETAVQALYRLRSARQRLAFQLPAGYKLDTQPLRINGQFQPLERGDGDQLFAPLVNQAGGEALLVELRYTTPSGASRLELPQFLDDPAVQQIYLCAYLPSERALLGWSGPWTEEFDWHWDSPVSMTPLVRQSDETLVRRVMEGTSTSDSPATGFPTDGVMFVYSTLRPDPAPAGSLRLVSLSRNVLHALSVIGLIAFGLALLARPFAHRLLALAGLIVGLVILGVFLPTFTRQLCDGAFVAVTTLVLIGWSGFSLSRAVRSFQAGRAARAAAAAPPPAPEPVEASPFLAAGSPSGNAGASSGAAGSASGDERAPPSGAPPRTQEGPGGSTPGGSPSSDSTPDARSEGDAGRD